MPRRHAWVCGWGIAKSHADAWREHISEVGMGNLDVARYADRALHGVSGTWVRRPG